MVTYEQRLDADPEWAMNEGGKHFEERSAVQIALRKIAERLGALEIPYAVAGGMALFAHGFRRFTEDVDILVTGEGLKAVHRELSGLGYRPPFEGSKNLREVDSGVRIEFLVTGQFPGDGKPKPVAFPEPAGVTFDYHGIKVLNLRTLVELKLASGMTNRERQKDLVDVQELIKLLELREEFGDSLNPYVRDKYRELWADMHSVRKRYRAVWHHELLRGDVQSIEQMIEILDAAGEAATATRLAALAADGVTLENPAKGQGAHAWLVTTEPSVAGKHGLHDESEFFEAE